MTEISIPITKTEPMDWSPAKSESSLPSPIGSRSRSGSPPPSTTRTVTINLFPLSDSIEFAPKHLSFNPDQEIKVGRVSGSRNQKEARQDNGVFSCDVMSREHALLKEEHGKILIKDLKSTHGTFINTIRLGDGSDESDWRVLNHGDVITFGHSVRRNQNLYKHLSAYIFYPKETKDDTLPPNKFNGATPNALPVPSPPTFIKTERISENEPSPSSVVSKEPVSVVSTGTSILQSRSEGPASYYIAKSGGLPSATSGITNPHGNKFGGLNSLSVTKPRITDNVTHTSEAPVTEPKQQKQEVSLNSSTSEEMLSSIQKLNIGQSDEKTHIKVERKELTAQTAKSDQDKRSASTKNDEKVENSKNVENVHKSVSSERTDEVTEESTVIRSSVSTTRTTVSFAAPAPVKERLSTQGTRETKQPSKISRREKDNSREKDNHREKENYRERESHSREREGHREKESHSREKEGHREKESHKEKDIHKDREVHKEAHKERESHKEKECLKEIESNREKESNTDTDKCENVSNGEGPSHVTEDDTSTAATSNILRKRKYEEVEEELNGPREVIVLKKRLAELEEVAIHENKRRKWDIVYSTVVGMAAGALSVTAVAIFFG